MIIVNTSFHIEKEIEQEVLDWIRRSYATSSAKFNRSGAPMLTRILGSIDPETSGYALHISFDNISAAERWNDGVAANLRKIMHNRWGERALAFHTFLEVVE